MKRTGYYAGSFDPVTNGHLNIIERCANLVDELVLGIGVHYGKKTLLSADDRMQLLKDATAPVARATGMKIRVETFDNLVVDAAREAGAPVIIRGLRNTTDFDYEAQMGQMNAAMAPGIETVYLVASPQTAMISSSLVKQIAAMDGDISSFLPPEAVEAVMVAVNRKS